MTLSPRHPRINRMAQRPQRSPAMFQRIVVGLDGSRVSETALRIAGELARRLDVPLHLVRVADLAVAHWGANQAAAAYAELSGEMVKEKEKPARYLDTVRQPL